ncbi:unnamed protein product [Miscanthus lutarioriparius]|uniref:hydroxyacylglutathione hydrolase n=1 Tax=Miscanthus lutarioriparius TaxID=422564 RepID=A0A811MR90_9POAL|nr:unnamed protein product [Miscanthus lutarioriparius]
MPSAAPVVAGLLLPPRFPLSSSTLAWRRRRHRVTGPAPTADPVPLSLIAMCTGFDGTRRTALCKTYTLTVLFWDHAGGNEKMRLQVPGIKVFGGSLDNVKGCTDQVENGTKLSLGKDIEILCLHTPCHTKGHISYYVTSKEGEDPAVFTGDTLFIAGCGKFFEGTAEQMYQSLIVTLGSLPKSTQVYCGHEAKFGANSPVEALRDVRKTKDNWKG